MADLGQDAVGLQLKIDEVKIRIKKKNAAKVQIDIDRDETEYNIKKLEAKRDTFDDNLAEIDRQIESDNADLASLQEALSKQVAAEGK